MSPASKFWFSILLIFLFILCFIVPFRIILVIYIIYSIVLPIEYSIVTEFWNKEKSEKYWNRLYNRISLFVIIYNSITILNNFINNKYG